MSRPTNFTNYQASATASAIVSTKSIIQLVPPPTVLGNLLPVRMGLTRLSVTLADGTAAYVALTAATAIGTPDGAGTFPGIEVCIGGGGYNTTQGKMETLWTVEPTYSSTQLLEQAYLPAIAGASCVWTWPDEDPMTLKLGTGSPGLLLVNLGGGATGTLLVTAAWSEYRDTATSGN